MAEVVESRIEEMLPELEQMERVGLFTKSEIRQITGKRKVHEYKLRRKKKEKEDFLHYIQYETNLLALVKKRRERTGYTFKKLEIDNAILLRIHRLFRIVLHRFPEDVKLWLSYIAFAKQLRAKDTVSRQYTKMLQVHDKKPDLWLSAAKWEFEQNNNTDNARSLLQRSLRFNNTSKKLWLEYYRMELMFAEKMRRRRELIGDTISGEDEISDAVLKGTVASIVYQQAIAAIPDDVSFIVSFLPISQLFEFAQHLQQDIYTQLEEKHLDKPLVWDALAKRHFKPQMSTQDMLDAERKFHEVYEEAVSKISSGELWELYINSCLQLIPEARKKSHQAKRLQRALLVFEEAQEAGYLTPKLYTKWIELLSDSGWPDEALEVSKTAVKTFPGEAQLWMNTLQLMLTTCQGLQKMQATLKEAQTQVPKKEMWPLVQIVLEHSICVEDQDATVQLLEKSMIDHSHISTPAKELYLEHEYLKHGIQHARKIFSRICEHKPVSCDLYRNYISMELSQSKPKMKYIRAVYEDTVREHGQSNPDVWLDYIKLECASPQGKPEKVGNIHFRAVKALTGKNNLEFIQKYTQLQTASA